MDNPYWKRQILFWFTFGILLGAILARLAFAQTNGLENLSIYQSSGESSGESGEQDYVSAPPLFIQRYAKQLAAIRQCESGNRHYDANGNVIKSRTNDYGLYQINRIWLPVAEEMGIDVMTPEGNEEMAYHILSVQGLNAWVCWKKIIIKK